MPKENNPKYSLPGSFPGYWPESETENIGNIGTFFLN
jgi:hypothetical protein